jgi:hypothetical protein
MAKSPSQPRAFSFAERVAFQRAIEDVYWRHRIWPKENPDRKPALDAVMSQAQLENKVAGYLRDSLMVQERWQKPITAEQLQAEMDPTSRSTGRTAENRGRSGSTKTSTGADKTPAATPSTLITASTTAQRG